MKVMARRKFVGLATAASLSVPHAMAKGREQFVPNSTGSEAPALDAMPNACDCHHHIYDERFPVSPHWKL